MRILVADDERVTRTILIRTLQRWNFEVVEAEDGEAAWALLHDGPPTVAILDWMMPGLDGPSLCQRVRLDPVSARVYAVLLSAKNTQHDLVAGLEAGADDYLRKPFDPDELRARINVGVRVLGLQERLSSQVAELQSALSRVHQLQGLLPICSYCKRVRSDQDYWEQIDTYVAQHSDAQFSHGICPACMDRAMSDMGLTDEAPKSRPARRLRWR